MKFDKISQEKITEHYWIDKLKDIEDLDLCPVFKHKSEPDSFIPETLSIDFPEGLQQQLEKVSRQSDLGNYLLAICALQILLQKYTEKTNILLTLPNLKSGNGSDEAILFLNTDVSGEISSRQLLAIVQNSFNEICNYPLENVDQFINYLSVNNKLQNEGLLKIGVMYDGINASPLWLQRISLLFKIQKTNTGLKLSILYNGYNYSKAFIRQLGDHFAGVLTSMLADINKPIKGLSLNSQKHDQSPVHFAAVSETVAYKSIHEIFELQAAKAPDATALRYANVSLSYDELNKAANKLASLLRYKYESGPESITAIIMDRSEKMLIALLGILKSGSAYLPIDIDYPLERIEYMLKDSGAKRIVTNDSGLLIDKGIDQHQYNIIALEKEGEWNYASDINLPSITSPDNLAYIIYTSGSTGNPKGVMVEHRNVISLFFAKGFPFSFSSLDSWTLFHSISFDFSVWEVFGALLFGGKLVVLSKETLLNLNLLVNVLIKENVTVFNQVPGMFYEVMEYVLKNNNRVPLKLKYIVFGGDKLNPARLSEWQKTYPEIALVNMYGITETTVHTTYKLIASKDIEEGFSNIGTPLSSLSIKIVDDNLETRPNGTIGEILIAGHGVTRGYLKRVDLTNDKFIQSGDDVRWYCSGDLGIQLPDGDLIYAGRKDQQVKIRGHRIETKEIENVLLKYEGISQVHVLADTDADHDSHLVAFTVSQFLSSSQELRDFLFNQIPAYMIPSYFVPLEKIPLTANGKIDQKALVSLKIAYLKKERSNLYSVKPSTNTESILQRIWQNVLGINEIRIHDNFFDLHGDSLKAIRVMNKIREALREIVHVSAIFKHPTIEALAKDIDKYRSLRKSSLDEAKISRMKGMIKTLPAFNPSPKKNPSAVFILSPPRSGSTLLRVILAGHSKIFSPPELELLSFNTLAERKRTLSGKLSFFSEGTIRAIMEYKKCDATEARRIMESHEADDLSTQEFYRIIQDKIDGKILVDKTPSYALDLEMLKRAEKYFENPMYIHLVRHPGSVVKSYREAKMDQIFRYDCDFSVNELGEFEWLVSHENILKFLEGVDAGRQIMIKFEDLVTSTEETVRRVCDHFSLEFEHRMLDVYEDAAARMTNGIYKESNMIGDIKFFTHTKIDSSVNNNWIDQGEHYLSSATEKVAACLGYECCNIELTKENHSIPTIPNQPYYEVSNAQRRLWILDQYEEKQSAYNIPCAFLLRGNLNVIALEKAFESLIKRHEILRTTFQLIGGELKQIIDFDGLGGFKWTYLDAVKSNLDIKDLIHEEASTSFDLIKGPLLRARLCKINVDEYVLLFTIHHIISDGWSMDVIVREFTSLYNCEVDNQPSQMPELTIQYKEYAAWHNKLLEEEDILKHRDYWLQQLAGDLTVLNLPTDFTRPPVKTFNGGTIGYTLPSDIAEKLQNISLQHGATMFMTLLTAVKTLLFRYSNQQDIIVGAPIAGRDHVDLENQIGFYVNYLALRSRFSSEYSFDELLASVKKIVVEAYEHQVYPFNKLIADLDLFRDTSRSPLFDVVVSVQNMGVKSTENPVLKNVSIKTLAENNHASKVDLIFSFHMIEKKILGSIEFNSDLFKESSIKEMATHFIEILEQLVFDTSKKISDIVLSHNLLNATSEQSVVDNGNNFNF
jgi:amino acid adenylation domain-containing protein